MTTVAVKRLSDMVRHQATSVLHLQMLSVLDVVFGSSLSELCGREHSTVPRFIQECVFAVENRGRLLRVCQHRRRLLEMTVGAKFSLPPPFPFPFSSPFLLSLLPLPALPLPSHASPFPLPCFPSPPQLFGRGDDRRHGVGAYVC